VASQAREARARSKRACLSPFTQGRYTERLRRASDSKRVAAKLSRTFASRGERRKLPHRSCIAGRAASL
jgi:hypothetical protein